MLVQDEFRCHYHKDGSGYDDNEVQQKLDAVNDVYKPFAPHAKWHPAEKVPDDSGTGWKVVIRPR